MRVEVYRKKIDPITKEKLIDYNYWIFVNAFSYVNEKEVYYVLNFSLENPLYKFIVRTRENDPRVGDTFEYFGKSYVMKKIVLASTNRIYNIYYVYAEEAR